MTETNPTADTRIEVMWLARLDAPARQWLQNAPEVAHPGHAWLDEL